MWGVFGGGGDACCAHNSSWSNVQHVWRHRWFHRHAQCAASGLVAGATAAAAPHRQHPKQSPTVTFIPPTAARHPLPPAAAAATVTAAAAWWLSAPCPTHPLSQICPLEFTRFHAPPPAPLSSGLHEQQQHAQWHHVPQCHAMCQCAGQTGGTTRSRAAAGTC